MYLLTHDERRSRLTSCRTAREVAQRLREAGITGSLNSLTANPISVYLGEPLDGPGLTSLTEAERAFLERFDRARYEDLLDMGTSMHHIANAAHAVLLALEEGAEHGTITGRQFALLDLALRRLRDAIVLLRGF
jgi:hypothetical protein